MNKSINKKRVIYTLVGIALIVIISMVILAYNILWGGNLLVFKVNPVVNVISKVTTAEKTGETLSLKGEDLNGILELYLKEKNSQGPFTIKGVYSKIENDKLSFYIPIKYKQFNFLVYCDGKLDYDKNKLIFTPSSFKVGKINFSVTFVLNKLKAYSSNIDISKKTIELSKDILPFNVTALSVSGDKLLATIQKVIANETPIVTPPTSGQATPGKTKSPDEIKKDLLSRTANQLGGVYSAVKTQTEKQVISTIQNVVSKMLQSPAYAYQAEADSVKARYNNLTSTEKDDIKDSILNNMEIDTLRYLKTTFGL